MTLKNLHLKNKFIKIEAIKNINKYYYYLKYTYNFDLKKVFVKY